MKKYLLILICIFFLATRLYKISEIPPSVYWDEASIGYNAYSISQDGKDEWGDFLPIHFRAFGEFKLPVYIYAVVPFVKFFGLNELSVRIPSVLFSLGVVIMTFFLAKKVTGSSAVGLWSSFFVTISPWFFIFSRTGFEATAGLMFYILGIWLFLVKRGGKFLLLSALSFILSAYSYNSFRVIAPLTILILLMIEKDYLRQLFNKSSPWIVLTLAFLALSIWPIFRLYFYDVGLFRLQAVGKVDTFSFFKNYLAHFNPHFLFIQGDINLRHQQQGFGQLYFPEIALIILGLFYIIKNNYKHKWLPIVLILLSPIPASLTSESPHALRAISTVPFLCMLSALGINLLKKLGYFFNLGIIALFGVFFINYFINFITIYPIQSANFWQVSYKRFFSEYRREFMKYDRVMVSDKYAQPYIFALFYLKYDPDQFRQEVIRNPIDNWGFSTVKKFGKFEFGKLEKLLEEEDGKVLIFASESEVYEK